MSRALLNDEIAAVSQEITIVEATDGTVLHFTFVLLLVCLMFAYLAGYFLHLKHIHWIPEAGASLIIGAVVGLIIHLASPAGQVERLIKFDEQLFFLVFLPPIIFESGYNMKRRKFFANIFPILMFAMVGTAVSAAVIGALIYMVGQIGLCTPLPLVHSLIFGALISATDPVTVLAIFGSMGADLNLYSMVFGESVLNDAVAIVLYNTLLVFVDNPVTGASVGLAFLTFLKVFIGSFLVGAFYALFSAFLFKFTRLRESEDLFYMEVTLTFLFPYMSWMTAEGAGLSGIVAILFCGIVMAHYTRLNLSKDARDFTGKFYKTLAFLSESFVFIYLGLSTFTFQQDTSAASFVFFSIIIILVARTFNVYPNAWIVNLFRSEQSKINPKFQFVLWFSGLRGAIAFALAIKSREDFAEEYASPIFSATIWIVMFTVLTMGGGCHALLTKLEVMQNPDDADAPIDPNRAPRTAKMMDFDRRILKPLFTRRMASKREQDSGPGDIEMGERDEKSLLGRAKEEE